MIGEFAFDFFQICDKACELAVKGYKAGSVDLVADGIEVGGKVIAINLHGIVTWD
jgi:hypothetical protein